MNDFRIAQDAVLMHILIGANISIVRMLSPRAISCEARAGSEKLWKVWWLWGIPVGWTARALIIFAEIVREVGYGGWGDLLDVARLLIYFGWARLAWRCAHNVQNRAWTPVSRFALGAGFISMAMF
jgi:hypothetical protein